jgi:hypothetical protein
VPESVIKPCFRSYFGLGSPTAHICTGTGLSPATSAPEPGSPPATVAHLHRDGAHTCHICTETALTPATSAPGLGSPLPHLHRDLASPLPHLHRDLASPPATSAPGLRSPLPHLRRDWARPLPCCSDSAAGAYVEHAEACEPEAMMRDVDEARPRPALGAARLWP